MQKLMNKTTIITLVVILLILGVMSYVTYVFISIPNDRANSDAQKSLVTSDEQVFTDLQGNQIGFNDYQGKVRVVNSWASWTPFSQQELPLLEELAKEYKDREVVVLAINRKEQREFAVSYLSTLQTFENVIFAIDLTDSFYTSIGGFSMPETIFYDATGNIIFHKRGNMTYEEMKLHTEAALSSSR